MVRAGARHPVVVVDADEIYRAGVVEWCRQQPEIDVVTCCDPAEVAIAPVALSEEPATVLIEVSGRAVEPDQYSGVAAIAQLRRDLAPAQTRIIATCRLAASRYLALRLAEAGADFVVLIIVGLLVGQPLLAAIGAVLGVAAFAGLRVALGPKGPLPVPSDEVPA